jgi:hypothetical protein
MLLAARPLIALQALHLKGAAITGIIRAISSRGAAAIRIVRVVATSLTILIISAAAISFALLLLVSLFDFTISSITQINA